MLGLPFRVIAPDVDESLLPSEQPEAYVTRLAREKARTVAARARGAPVLAADTTVVLRGRVFGKPADPAEATDMRSEEHTSELQSQSNLVCRLLLEKKNKNMT